MAPRTNKNAHLQAPDGPPDELLDTPVIPDYMRAVTAQGDEDDGFEAPEGLQAEDPPEEPDAPPAAADASPVVKAKAPVALKAAEEFKLYFHGDGVVYPKGKIIRDPNVMQQAVAQNKPVEYLY